MADDRNWLIDHTGIGVSKIFRSAKFYEAALRPLGIEALVRIARNFKRIDKDGPVWAGWVSVSTIQCSGSTFFHPQIRHSELYVGSK